MVYALAVVILLQTVAFAWVVLTLVKHASEERSELEMKLLAVCNAPAANHVESLGMKASGSVRYMDDEAMIEHAKTTTE